MLSQATSESGAHKPSRRAALKWLGMDRPTHSIAALSIRLVSTSRAAAAQDTGQRLLPQPAGEAVGPRVRPAEEAFGVGAREEPSLREGKDNEGAVGGSAHPPIVGSSDAPGC